jgi:hypothetical protein
MMILLVVEFIEVEFRNGNTWDWDSMFSPGAVIFSQYCCDSNMFTLTPVCRYHLEFCDRSRCGC